MACSFRASLSFGFLALVVVTGLSVSTLPAFAQDQRKLPQQITPQPSSAPSAVDAARLSPQGKFVQELGDRAISILSNKVSSSEQRSQQFRTMLRESFDLPTIARFVIGRTWNSATPEQQTEYMNLFETLIVKTYTDRFALYTGEGFGVRTVNPEGDRDFMVKSEISHPDGSPATSVNWRVRQKGEKLGIIDVVVEGVSMSVTQRQEYASVIERNGGNIDALLEMMRQRAVSNTAPQAKKQG